MLKYIVLLPIIMPISLSIQYLILGHLNTGNFIGSSIGWVIAVFILTGINGED